MLRPVHHPAAARGVPRGGEHEVTGRIASQSPCSLPFPRVKCRHWEYHKSRHCGQEGCPNFIERCPEHRQE